MSFFKNNLAADDIDVHRPVVCCAAFPQTSNGMHKEARRRVGLSYSASDRRVVSQTRVHLWTAVEEKVLLCGARLHLSKVNVRVENTIAA